MIRDSASCASIAINACWVPSYSTLLVFSFVDPSPAGSYPEWDEGSAGADEAAGVEDPYYEEQGEVDAVFDTWDD